MAPKAPKVERRSPDSIEQPANVRCQEHPIGHGDEQQPTSAPKDDAGRQSNGEYYGGGISCNDTFHNTENDPWGTNGETPPDPVSSH